MSGPGATDRLPARQQQEHLQMRSASSDVDLKQAAQLLGSFKHHPLHATQPPSPDFPESPPDPQDPPTQQLFTPQPSRRPPSFLLRATQAKNWAHLDDPSDSEGEDLVDASQGAARSLPSGNIHTRSGNASGPAPSKSHPPSATPGPWQGFQLDTSPRSGQASHRSSGPSKRSTGDRGLDSHPSQRRKVSPPEAERESPQKLAGELLSTSSAMQGLTAARRSRGTDQETTSSGLPQRSSRSGIASREAIPCAAAARLRGSKGQGLGSLHPVLALGWAPLCEVHCNGLIGKFLGGHDRDLYIQCTSREFAGAPPVDVSNGGCILSCSQFEKCAGRELSKKWKESIHVTGEGEGSKATLIAWLKRRAAQQYGQRVVGQHVWVCWCADATFYKGLITHYSPETGKHKVRYGDRFVEELHLPVEVLSFEGDPPGSTGTPRSLGELPSGPSEAPALEATRLAHASPLPWGSPALEGRERDQASIATLTKSVTDKLPGLLRQDQIDAIMHQGSGVSVTSDYKLNAEWKLGQADLDLINTGNMPLLADIAVTREAGSGLAATGSPKPGTGKISEEQDGEACCGDSMSQDLGVPGSFPKKPRSGRTPRAGAKPKGLMSEWLAGILPSDMPAAPEPPTPAGSADVPEHAQVAWLHDLALHLDPALSLPELAQPGRTWAEPLGRALPEVSALCGEGEGPALSASACFQALLVHASPAAVKGYYQALASRYRHFRGQPQQQAKLVELVLAALQQRHVASHEASPAPSSLHTGPLSTGHTGPLLTGGKLSPAPRLSG